MGRNENYWKKTYEIADILGLEVKVIPVFTKDVNRIGCITDGIGPKEFLDYISKSAFICTDSFHGTAFAINLQKQFMTFERFGREDKNNQNSRIYNILDNVGLLDRVYNEKKYKSICGVRIDYEKVEELLYSYRKKSMDFLKNALNSIENVSCYREKNIGKEKRVNLCCGCGSCKITCPVDAIKLSTNNGFWQATVVAEKCINCGKCVKVCPFIGLESDFQVLNGKLYSYKDKSDNVLLNSSSGGAAYRLAKILWEKGYGVVGCCYDTNKASAKHILISRQEQLNLIQGSKYVQSDFFNALHEIKNYNRPLVIFGTPCQIAGAKKALNENNNVIYIDLICHGVPTQLAMDKYINYLQRKKQFFNEKFNVIFRYKKRGWHERYIFVSDSGHVYCQHQSKDPFFRLFESGFCYSEACYECRWRDRSEADIRVGDYWGAKFKKDHTGVSMVLACNRKGDETIEELEEHGKLQKQDIKDYFINQQTSNSHMPVFYNRLLLDLKNENVNIENCINSFIAPTEKRLKLSRRVRKIVHIVLRH